MTPPVHDFRLYHSNALDVLAELLAEELRKDAGCRPRWRAGTGSPPTSRS